MSSDEGLGEVGGGVGGGERDLVSAICERDRDSGGDGRLADAALAHRHHDPVSRMVELVDQILE